MKAILERLKQESTWRGIVLLVSAFGISVEPELQNAIIAAGISIVGLINVLKKD